MALGRTFARTLQPGAARRAPQQPDVFVRSDLLSNMLSRRALELSHIPKRTNVSLGLGRPQSAFRLLPINRATWPPSPQVQVTGLALSRQPRGIWRTQIVTSATGR
jgi:hypothetical protein